MRDAGKQLDFVRFEQTWRSLRDDDGTVYDECFEVWPSGIGSRTPAVLLPFYEKYVKAYARYMKQYDLEVRRGILSLMTDK